MVVDDADADGLREIAVHAIEVDRHVEIDDVAILQDALAELEGGYASFVVGSGIAAVAVVWFPFRRSPRT